MTLTLATMIWNGEKYGFCYKEMITECLKLCDHVVVACPPSEDDTQGIMKAWSEKDPRVQVVDAQTPKHKEDLATIANMAVEQAPDGLVLHVQGDEFLEMNHTLKVYIESISQALSDGMSAVLFPRWQFYWTQDLVTPSWHSRKVDNASRLFHKKWYPELRAQGDAMHVPGNLFYLGAQRIKCDEPIWHYHCLGKDEANWQQKEQEFQLLFVNTPDQTIKLGYRVAWAKKPRTWFPIPRPHPEGMRKWLEKSWLSKTKPPPFLEVRPRGERQVKILTQQEEEVED